MLQTELARKHVDLKNAALDTESREMHDELETFLFDNCMTVQE